MGILRAWYHISMLCRNANRFGQAFERKDSEAAKKFYKGTIYHANELNRIGVQYEGDVNPLDFIVSLFGTRLQYISGELTPEQYIENLKNFSIK